MASRKIVKQASSFFVDLPGQPSLYSETPVRELPGFFWKWVTINPGEIGLLLERGELKRKLPPGRHRVGWGFLRLGSRCSVGRLRNDAFTIPFRFYRLGDDTKEPLDAFTQATVVVTDASGFYRYGAAGRTSLTARQLGNMVSASVQVMLGRLATFFDPALLRADPRAGERLTERIEALLAEQFKDRGLRLEKVFPLVFRPSRETETLLEEVLNLQAEIAAPGGKDSATLRRKVEQFAARALEVELASPSEVEVLRAAAGTRVDTSSSGFVDTMELLAQRLTGQASERAQRLSLRKKAARVKLTLQAWLGWLGVSLTGLLVVAVIAAVPVYWLWYRGQGVSWQTYLAGFGAAAGGLRIMLLVTSEVEKRLKQREMQEETDIPWFKKWLRKDAALVDELIRQQVATEIESGPAPDLQAAATQCHADGRAREATELRKLGEELHLLALRIRGAEYAGTLLSSGGGREAIIRSGRLIAFEEETMRLSHLIGTLVSRLKAKIPTKDDLAEDMARLREAIEALRKHFASRPAVIVGFPKQGEGA